MAEKKSSTGRYRNFATIVYPESAVSDWQEILSSYHVPAFVSPGWYEKKTSLSCDDYV